MLFCVNIAEKYKNIKFTAGNVLRNHGKKC